MKQSPSPPVDVARLEERREAQAIAEIAPNHEPIMGGVMGLGEPGSWINQAVGIGLDGPATETELDRLVAYYTEHNIEPRVEICPFVDESLLKGLESRGFMLREFANILARPIGPDLADNWRSLVVQGWPVDEAGRELRIVPVSSSADAHFMSFAEVSMKGFLPEPKPLTQGEIQLGRNIIDHQRSEGYVALFGDEVVAAAGAEYPLAGSIGPVASLFGTTVLEPFRRRGIQQTLIAHRMGLAAKHGAELVTIGSRPGIPTERNAMRLGFSLAYTKVALAKPGPGLTPSR
ncbi:MAG TPA: GNAT family N-acetyltransferase [Phycisphaerales bacterium]|nr:GNAT family N-acetyltransferase [Phycisphaerales bacterium]